MSEDCADRLVATEDFTRQPEKGFAVGVERDARGAFDGGAHLRLALCQQFSRAGALLLVAGDARAGLGQIGTQDFGPPAGAQSTHQISDDGGRERGDDAEEDGCVHTEPLRGLSSHSISSSGVSSQP